MSRAIIWLLSITAIALLGSQPHVASSTCGYCEPGWAWEGVDDGAYRFDSTVSEDVRQTTFWADDGWGNHYYDEGNPNAIVITVADVPGGFGSYNWGTNTLTIDDNVAANCPPSCSFLESVISHELGHSLGLGDIAGGCETSIMSYDRNRNFITGPNSEDLCWLYNGYDGWEGDGGGCTECEDRPGVPLFIVDYRLRAPTSWRAALDSADLVAVIHLRSQRDENNRTSLPLTHFDADVLEVIKDSRNTAGSGTISITRFGGLQEVAGATRLAEESGFRPWAVGQRVLVFAKWSDRLQSYTLPFGPAAAFGIEADTNKVRTFTRSQFARSQDGKSLGALLTEVRSAR